MRIFLVLVGALSIFASGARADAVFTRLPGLSVWPRGVASEGNVVVGEASGGAFRWSEADGITFLGFISARGVSDDGTTAAGIGGAYNRALRWTALEGVRELGDLPGGQVFSRAWAVSADGSTLVGIAEPDFNQKEAFRWTEHEGMIGLGWIEEDYGESDARGVSADGSTIVGTSTGRRGFEAFRWTQAEGMVGLGDLPRGDFHSVATDVSADGNTVVGCGTNETRGFEPFRWTERDGLVGLGYPSDGIYTIESCNTRVSADGRAVVGDARREVVPGLEVRTEPFIWDPANGMRFLTDVLKNEYALDLGDLEFRSLYADDISSDGNAIAIHGTTAGGGAQRGRGREARSRARPGPPLAGGCPRLVGGAPRSAGKAIEARGVRGGRSRRLPQGQPMDAAPMCGRLPVPFVAAPFVLFAGRRQLMRLAVLHLAAAAAPLSVASFAAPGFVGLGAGECSTSVVSGHGSTVFRVSADTGRRSVPLDRDTGDGAPGLSSRSERLQLHQQRASEFRRRLDSGTRATWPDSRSRAATSRSSTA